MSLLLFIGPSVHLTIKHTTLALAPYLRKPSITFQKVVKSPFIPLGRIQLKRRLIASCTD